MPFRQVRASYDDECIRVYQAYAPAIASAAVRAGRFVSPFKIERMTWIKPSFLWMMYRSGWATKDGQERVLAIDITREGFEWALANACLSHYDPKVHASDAAWATSVKATPVRVQWDPERNAKLVELPYRSIQIGLSGEAVRRYVHEWTVRIEDVTDYCHETARAVQAGADVTSALPRERAYPLRDELRRRLGAD